MQRAEEECNAERERERERERGGGESPKNKPLMHADGVRKEEEGGRYIFKFRVWATQAPFPTWAKM